MTAAALLVVLGAALVTQLGGLSMAMGAFLAGVVLSESTFRHELEADVEPFRGILLGLFFLSVGMSLDLSVIATDWPLILAAVAAFMAVKGVGIYAVARIVQVGPRRGAPPRAPDGAGRRVRLRPLRGRGECRHLRPDHQRACSTPRSSSRWRSRRSRRSSRAGSSRCGESFDGVDKADGLTGKALVIGFGRFGQVASQALLARQIDVSIIDSDTDMIRAAARFGFKIYYGDGTRLDVLRAAGAGSAEAILICIDKPESADRIVEIVKAEFPLAKLLVRSFDRGHSLRLVGAGVDYQIRETFESAMRFGEAALVSLGVPEDEAAETIAGVRRRDEERFAIQMAEGIYAGRDLMVKQREPTPTPLSTAEARRPAAQRGDGRRRRGAAEGRRAGGAVGSYG